MKAIRTLSALALAVAIATSAAAGGSAKSSSGSYGNLNWQAQSTLVGVTATGGDSGGDPIYWPSFPAVNGVVGLFMNYDPNTPTSGFVCTGTLLSDRRSILTAAHCVSDGFGTAGPASVTAFFNPGLAPTERIYFNPGATAVAVSGITVNPGYSGDVIDDSDIAVLTLSTAAPAWATSYQLYTGSDLKGQDFGLAGYGLRSAVGGATGYPPSPQPTNVRTGALREGDNTFDFRFGDAAFGAVWAGILGEPMGQIDHSWISDFDSGLATNDASCRITQASNFGGLPGTQFCDLGVGALEVGVAGGDSGGPNFINGQIAAVNSYGLSFGTAWGDAVSGLQSSFGEFSGYVPVYTHLDFINAAMVPEPESYALMALGLLALGGVLKRRRR